MEITLRLMCEIAFLTMLLLFLISFWWFCAIELCRRRNSEALVEYRDGRPPVLANAVLCVNRRVQADTSIDIDVRPYVSVFNLAFSQYGQRPTPGEYQVEKETPEMDVQAEQKEPSDEVVVVIPSCSSAPACVP